MTSPMHAGEMLAHKISGALLHRGYGENVIKKVEGLVYRNLIMDTVSKAGGGTDDMHMHVERSLQRIQEVTRLMNSNEPVLLINTKRFDDQTDLVAATLQQLHTVYQIWPVQVYAGDFVDVAEGQWFELVLLNVVNTEIGGPSMVQLLDDEDTGSDHAWNRWSIREFWRDRQFVSRDERRQTDTRDERRQTDTSASADLPVTKTTVPAPEAAAVPLPDGKGEKLFDVAEDSDSADDVKSPPLAEDSTGSATHQTVPDTDDESTSQSREHPEMAALLESEARRPAMRYPSWDRSHDSHTLGDLVRRQSSRIFETEDEKENLDPESSLSNKGVKEVVRPQVSGDAEEAFEIL